MDAFNIENYSLVYQMLIILFAGSFILQAIYWAAIHSRILSHHPTGSGIKRFPVSIIICARNEEENLRANLPLILDQDYPDYEVLVVDDASSDGTEELLQDLMKVYPNLKTSTIRENMHIRQGKKLALTVGIKGASHDWVLLTDADCRPAGRKWLFTMQRNFRRDVDIILGYGAYRKVKGLLNILIRYDALFTAIQYLGFAQAGHPYMGVGRNLAYRKSIFFEIKGFAAHYHLASGDDDLFVNEAAKSRRAEIEIRQESHTISTPETSWRNWYYQKKRHMTTGPHYRFKSKVLLGGELASRMLFYPLFIILLTNGILVPFVVGLFIIRLILAVIIFKLAMQRLNERYLLLPSPLLDFGLPWIELFMVMSNFVAKKRGRWK